MSAPTSVCRLKTEPMHAPAVQVLDYANVLYGPETPDALQKTYVVCMLASMRNTCTLRGHAWGPLHCPGDMAMC